MIPLAATPWEDLHRQRAEFAYGKFREGWGTQRIAARMNIKESQALKLVTLGRCYAKSLANPYPA